MSTFILQDSQDAPDIDIEADDAKVPDGGYDAWGVVVASCVIHIATIGVISTFGVWQDYYVNNPDSYQGPHSDNAVGFIGSLANAGIGAFGVPSGMFAVRFGYRTTAVVSGVGMALSLILASFSVSYWQLLLTQGLMISVAFPVGFFAAINIISQWWKEVCTNF